MADAVEPHLLAAWCEEGGVRIFDTAALRASLDAAPSAKPTNPNPARLKPVGASGGAHSTEGFALAWSPLAAGRLASGDCAGGLRVWEPTEGGGSGGPSSAPSPACGGGSRWGQRARGKRPHPNLPPHAGEGDKLAQSRNRSGSSARDGSTA